MGDPLSTLGKLGSPEIIHDPYGAGEKIDRLYLVDADIDVFQDVVIGMSTTSPDWQMPSGLRVGLTRGEVIRIFGRVPNGHTATSPTFTAHVCMDNQDLDALWTILIDFGQDKRVNNIHFVSLSY
jgi:hypothetical protein